MAGLLIVNHEVSKTFIWNPRSQKGTYTNSTGGTVTLPKGRLLGRKTSGQIILPHVSTATDGSEQPVGVLMDDYGPVANLASITVTFCDGGDVAEEKIILGGADTMGTIIANADADVSVRDAIARNTHIKLIPSTELTEYDNQ